MEQHTRLSTPLATLTRALAGIARAQTSEEVVGSIRSIARKLVGCDGITVILKDGDMCHYVEEDAIGPLWKGQRFAASNCVSGWAIHNRQTAVIPDISEDERVPYQLYAGTFVRAMAMAPVRTEDPVGALGAYWSHPYTPTDWEIETLEALAEAAAIAFRNEEILKRQKEFADLREQFFAALGHDLRNPVAALNAGTSRLLREGWSDNSPHILGLMKGSILRMSGLVENVMDLARARMGGGIQMSPTSGDLAATLAHVIEEVRWALPNHTILESWDLPKLMKVDHLRLGQLVSNLVTNAVTHGDGRLPVHITGMISGSHLEICVSNCGKALEQNDIETLFVPFKRGDGKVGKPGLGLGLFIASEIAQAHGGRIEVCSDSEKTTFTFRMPVTT